MIILRYHEIFSGWQHQQPCRDTLVLSAWKKYHDIIILRFCNIVEGQAICMYSCTHTRLLRFYKKNHVTCKKIGYYVYLNPHFFISELHYLFIHLWYEVLHWKTPKHHITYENTDGSWSSLSWAQDLTFMKSLNSGPKFQGSAHHYM